jgi:hypothetical protein
MLNEQRILRIADELEKQQADRTYLDATIYNNLQLTKAMFYRLKKKAMLEVQKRTEFKQSLINEVITHEVTEAARNGLKSDLEIEQQLCKIAFGEIDVMETTSTPDGIIEFNRKPTPNEMINAMKELWKKRGTYAPDKVESIISSYNITLNLNK